MCVVAFFVPIYISVLFCDLLWRHVYPFLGSDVAIPNVLPFDAQNGETDAREQHRARKTDLRSPHCNAIVISGLIPNARTSTRNLTDIQKGDFCDLLLMRICVLSKKVWYHVSVFLFIHTSYF